MAALCTSIASGTNPTAAPNPPSNASFAQMPVFGAIMARVPKRATVQYPMAMLDILENLCEYGTPAVIEYPDKRKCLSERMRFYNLIKTLRLNHHTMADKLETVILKVSGADKNVLTINFINHSADNAFYEEAIRKNAERLKLEDKQ
jgi:hypothetical protein